MAWRVPKAHNPCERRRLSSMRALAIMRSVRIDRRNEETGGDEEADARFIATCHPLIWLARGSEYPDQRLSRESGIADTRTLPGPWIDLLQLAAPYELSDRWWGPVCFFENLPSCPYRVAPHLSLVKRRRTIQSGLAIILPRFHRTIGNRPWAITLERDHVVQGFDRAVPISRAQSVPRWTD